VGRSSCVAASSEIPRGRPLPAVVPISSPSGPDILPIPIWPSAFDWTRPGMLRIPQRSTLAGTRDTSTTLFSLRRRLPAEPLCVVDRLPGASEPWRTGMPCGRILHRRRAAQVCLADGSRMEDGCTMCPRWIHERWMAGAPEARAGYSRHGRGVHAAGTTGARRMLRGRTHDGTRVHEDECAGATRLARARRKEPGWTRDGTMLRGRRRDGRCEKESGRDRAPRDMGALGSDHRPGRKAGRPGKRRQEGWRGSPSGRTRDASGRGNEDGRPRLRCGRFLENT